MIYGGHLSHVSYATIKLARKTRVTILKLKPNTTDLLQPLHVAVFKSLKQNLGALLLMRLRKTRSALSKSKFAKIISSEEVWREAFSVVSIQNGFKK